MPSSKEHLALRWAQASDEEKSEKRRKHAEAQRRYRAKKGRKERSEMSADEIDWKRALDTKKQRKRRNKLTKEEKETIRAKDRDRKRKERKAKKIKKEQNSKANLCKSKVKNIDLHTLEKHEIKHQEKHLRKNRKVRDRMTEKEKENIHVDLVQKMRRKRSMMTLEGTLLAGIKAKEGMRVCRRFGYLRKYKQRKLRHDYLQYCSIGVNKDGYSSRSWYYIWKQNRVVRREREKQERTKHISKTEFFKRKLERKDDLKRMNRNRVKKHRLKVKKLLQEPVIIKDYGPKGDYELLREKNIRELEKLKKDSGMFD